MPGEGRSVEPVKKPPVRVIGLVPMALGLGEGSETNLPLARAVIGGLMVSTFFTLFLVPALYTLLDRFAKRKAPHEDDDEERVHA